LSCYEVTTSPRLARRLHVVAADNCQGQIVAKRRSSSGLRRQILPSDRRGWPVCEFFGLTKSDILAAARLTDDAVALWFKEFAASRPGIISQWNELALNLGKTGFPMAERLPVALATFYQNLDPAKISSVFEAIEADELVS
jgi:hypothetical protein